MAIADITKPMALDETLQGTNDILATLGKDVSLQAIATALSTLGLTSVGDLSQLTTEQKTSLVAAINEINGDLDNYVQKSNTPGLLKNDGTVDTNDYAEKVAGATNGNLAGLNGSGNLTDSGWNGAKDTTSISGNPISISGLKANQLAINPIITFEPIQAGSGTPSPSNIRAISGYDKIEVLSCGKNLFDSDKIKIGTYVNDVWSVEFYPSGTVAYDSITYKANTSYTFSGTFQEGVANKSYRLRVVYTDNTTANMFGDSDTSAHAFVFVSNDAKTISKLDVSYASGNGTFTLTNFQIEEGASATTYVPYHKTTDLSENLPQTVYGGSLDLNSGVLTVDRGRYKVDPNDILFDSTYLTITTGATPLKRVESDELSKYISSHMKSHINSGVASMNNEFTIDNNNKVKMRMPNTVTTSSGATDYFTNNDVYICGLLATPIEIQLTPTELTLLKDYAYVSTNGTRIDLDYRNGEMATLEDVLDAQNKLQEEIDNPISYDGKNYRLGMDATGLYLYNITDDTKAYIQMVTP